MNPSDLDTLADYVEGLLDGTPEADAVAERIATDPTWADAYQQLTAAAPQVTAALAELADPPLPPDVAAKLDATKYPAVQKITYPRRQFGGWAAAAVIILVICIGGFAVIRSAGTSSSNDTSSASEASGNSAPTGEIAAGGVRKSGLNYTSSTLGQQAKNLVEQKTFAANSPMASSASTSSSAVPGPAPAASLSRLTDPVALRSCLSALGVAAVEAVDYATFNGQPAVVIVTPDAAGTTWVVLAAGPECGVNGQPHLLQRTTVPR